MEKVIEILKKMANGSIVKVNGELLVYKEGSVGRPVQTPNWSGIEESDIKLNEFLSGAEGAEIIEK